MFFMYIPMLRTINKPAKDSRSALHLLEQVETTSSSIRTFLPASSFCVEQFWLFLSGVSIQILGRSDSWSEDILLRSVGVPSEFRRSSVRVPSEFFLNCKEGKERRGWLFETIKSNINDSLLWFTTLYYLTNLTTMKLIYRYAVKISIFT